MTELVTIDVGGTHVRFALANVEDDCVTRLGEPTTFDTHAFASLARAWHAFEKTIGKPLPRAAAISFAGPVRGDVLKLTNSPWVVRPSLLASNLGVDRVTLVNDFGAVAHAIAHVGPEYLSSVCGPDEDLPARGVISIIGPGTGLGVAHILRTEGRYHVVETEGGHIDFSPLDALEDQIVLALRDRYHRVSAERIVSGPGLHNIYDSLRRLEGREARHWGDDKLWEAAMDGSDALARTALDRFCLSFGSVAGDIALAQGGTGVVIAGGLGLRLATFLPASEFGHRFTAKGRFEHFMSAIPVKVITHPQPGLLGAAAAFVMEHGT